MQSGQNLLHQENFVLDLEITTFRSTMQKDDRHESRSQPNENSGKKNCVERRQASFSISVILSPIACQLF